MPLLKTCIQCGTRILRGSRCKRCIQPHRRYRSSSAWQRIAKATKASGKCLRCGAVNVPLHAHHPIPLSSGLRRAYETPPIPLCTDCHKTVHKSGPTRLYV